MTDRELRAAMKARADTVRRQLSVVSLEVFAYHRHPPQAEACHLHLGAGAGELLDAVRKAHFPAIATELPAIIRLLVEDFGFPARSRNWRALLAN